MKLPKTFRFMSATWHIQEGGVGRSGDSNKKYMGRAYYKKRLIAIRKDMSDDIKKATLMHEIMHVITDSIGQDVSEKFIEGMENAMMEALRQNDWIGEFFKEDKK